MTLEITFMWIAVSAYALSAILFVVRAVFNRAMLTRPALWIGLAGLVPHTIAIGVRWVRVGHGPYLGFYEAVSSFAYVTVVALGLIYWRRPSLVQVGVVLMPLAFLLIGASMLTPKTDLEITGTLASWWLTVHVAFAKLAYGAFIGAFGLAAIYLFREKARGLMREALDRLPRQDVIDDLAYRFVAAGFVFLTIMIVSGAIWADRAWGRYWAWDPVETWSLVSWLVYALYLHARLLLGWRGRRAAWLAIVALPIVVFSLIGVPLVYNSIHGAYLLGY